MKESNLLHELTAISSIDGRYGSKTFELRNYFSEYALIKYRVIVEVEYFKDLCDVLPQLKDFDRFAFTYFDHLVEKFSLEDAKRIKELEKVTNHDVKAVEYWLREKFDVFEHPNFGGRNISDYKEFIHFALTSFDTDGIARPLMLKDAHEQIMLPLLQEVITSLEKFAQKWNHLPMLARTHGQPASPTILGKEINVFVQRLRGQVHQLQNIPWSAKLGGATGNFNAHYIAYPDVNWIEFADNFVEKLGLVRTQVTTQIEPNDNLAAYCHAWVRINNILTDFVRDVWTYIMLECFKQIPKAGEVGSSTMPHKVNPLDFENAEGNFGIANALFEHFASKLTISRLQRDLSDSTVVRNMGVPLAHMIIAFKSILKGMPKTDVNTVKINEDLENNWAVVSEAVQTILRREGYPGSYDVLKELTRTGKKITKDTLHTFIDSLEISDLIKIELKAITPWNYIGVIV